MDNGWSIRLWGRLISWVGNTLPMPGSSQVAMLYFTSAATNFFGVIFGMHL